ncbi:unnamed protein product [Urochloa decumbens]|uniref:DUF4220 domain-containing protein n=1 Tax=Urochloa decumbens TaxID=240449 RepID=A0ABC9AM10_9POAL
MDENYYCTSNVSVSIRNVLDGIRPLMQKGNGLLLLNAILMCVVVGIGTYASRYCRHPLIGILFLGATTLFLPIISSVAASVTSTELLMRTTFGSHDSPVYCTQYGHLFLIFVWAGIVVVIGVNASVVVAGDAREGRNIAPPIALTGTAVWTTYLTISTLADLYRDKTSNIRFIEQCNVANVTVFGQLFLIMYAKLLLKYSAFYKAQRSFAHGRSPRLVAGYMAQLNQLGESNDSPTDEQRDDERVVLLPPPLLVMGEDNEEVGKKPHGYRFKCFPVQGDRLVTMDRVWQLLDMDNMLQRSAGQPKYLCFSFALFKLLRCRFAKYTISGPSLMKVQKFFRDSLIQGAGAGYERVFEVVAEELSFIHDYYYSSLPIYYSHHRLVIFSIILSFYSIGYCLYLMIIYTVLVAKGFHHSQIYCSDNCINDRFEYDFVGRYSDVVPIYLVAGLLVLAETREILFYICSNWTKVSLIYHYVNQPSWQRSPLVQKCASVVFKYCSSKLVNNCYDKMKQCSILDIRRREIPLLPSCLQHLHVREKVRVPCAVKAAIFEAVNRKCLVREQEGSLMHVRPPSSPISGYSSAKVIDDGKCPAYTILAWHIATTIFEILHRQPLDPECQHKITATHLSRYCAYLVACCPELLPDDDEWCKDLYDSTKKDAARVLSVTQGASCPELIELLSAQSNHELLKDGASLGKQLLDSDIGWEPLAHFWSEMILYVAPSENLEAHAEAIARGGELITLLWALLSHAGIVGRLELDDNGAATTSDDGRV